MNRTTKGLLLWALMLVLVFALSTTALAASPEDVVVVSYDQCFSGNDYVLLLARPGANTGSLSDSDILFIDQMTAGSSRIEAAVVYPAFDSCDAYIGGTFANGAGSPVKLGSFKASRTPGMLSTIGEEAFEGSAFTHVFLGDNVNTIESRAFANCGSLAYIYIPNSVQTIAGDAFVGCGNVVVGCRAGSAAQSFAQSEGIEFMLLD